MKWQEIILNGNWLELTFYLWWWWTISHPILPVFRNPPWSRQSINNTCLSQSEYMDSCTLMRSLNGKCLSIFLSKVTESFNVVLLLSGNRNIQTIKLLHKAVINFQEHILLCLGLGKVACSFLSDYLFFGL